MTPTFILPPRQTFEQACSVAPTPSQRAAAQGVIAILLGCGVALLYGICAGTWFLLRAFGGL
jgi:preprotein translocase subunit SecD